MFAIPGITALIVFILARPQEFLPLLQKVPFLHLFTALAVGGYIIDIRLRRLQPFACPTMPWVSAFVLWAIICGAAIVPEQLIQRTIEMLILFSLYGTVAHGIQRFRTFQLVIGTLCATCTFIVAVCFHQGLSPMQCIGGEEQDGAIEGTPDGRECETTDYCRTGDIEPGKEYRCEHVGAFGTFSVQERVRYRGELNDPNEVALTVCAGGLSALIGFAMRRKAGLFRLLLYACVAMTFVTVFLTQSRGGLVACMLVPGLYIVRKYGPLALLPALIVAVPVMLLGGRSGEAADLSTEMRYEAWATGLDMFHHSPIFGVGPRQFTEHNYLTAHNSYVLTLSELGMIGLYIFVAILYLSVKSLIVGLRVLPKIPGTAVAVTWGMSLLASMAGILFQINTLSFTYHPVLWLFFGLVGGWCSAVRHHLPDFNIKLVPRDLVIIGLMCGTYAFVILPVYLKLKGIA